MLFLSFPFNELLHVHPDRYWLLSTESTHIHFHGKHFENWSVIFGAHAHSHSIEIRCFFWKAFCALAFNLKLCSAIIRDLPNFFRESSIVFFTQFSLILIAEPKDRRAINFGKWDKWRSGPRSIHFSSALLSLTSRLLCFFLVKLTFKRGRRTFVEP